MMDQDAILPGHSEDTTPRRRKRLSDQAMVFVGQLEFECGRHQGHILMMSSDSKELLGLAMQQVVRTTPLRCVTNVVTSVEADPGFDEPDF